MPGAIAALDLAVRTGFAIGEAGSVPRSSVVVLKRSNEDKHIAFGNLIAFLDETFRTETPSTLVKEAMLPLQAFMSLGNAEKTVRMQAGMHAIVEGMCARYGVAWLDVADSTVRKHFIGQARLGDRAATKRAVIHRCHMLKLMPADCFDDNRADALATHDWACATLRAGSISTQRLVLFDAGGRIRG
jgi:hypothetical protein